MIDSDWYFDFIEWDSTKVLKRVGVQRHLSERESKNMIGAQMALEQKATMAQFVIENSGSLEDTRQQVGVFTDGRMLLF